MQHLQSSKMPSELRPVGKREIADALTTPHPSRSGIRLNHTMLRISDVDRSLAFYVDFLGMSRVFSMNTGPATVYYLSYPSPEDKEPLDIAQSMASRSGLLELVYIHPTGSTTTTSQSSTSLENPTASSVGFGNLGFRAPDVARLLSDAEKLGYVVQKSVSDTSGKALYIPGNSGETPFDNGFLAAYKQIGFLQDPDG